MATMINYKNEVDMQIVDLKIGDEIESKGYHKVTQSHIDKFADATGDHQWIHVDSDACEQKSPYKSTIAHGFLTLSLMPKMFASSLDIGASTTMINYGVDNLRFIEAVKVNAEIKYAFSLRSVENKGKGRLYSFEGRVLIKGSKSPALVATFLCLLLN